MDAAKREAIIAAAAQSFFSRGFAASSIEQIAADAGVSKVTIYNNFGDKRALLAAAVEQECSRMRGIFSFDGVTGDNIGQQLAAIGQAMLEFLSRPEIIQFERGLSAEIDQHPGIGEEFLRSGPYQMKAAFAAFLEEAEKRGELVVANHWLAAEQFVSMCKGMGELERRFGVASDPQEDAQRISGAVHVFLQVYGTQSG